MASGVSAGFLDWIPAGLRGPIYDDGSPSWCDADCTPRSPERDSAVLADLAAWVLPCMHLGCIRICMRTTLNIPDEALKRAAELMGVTEKTALVKMGLDALIARESSRRLAELGATEKDLLPVPRRHPVGKARCSGNGWPSWSTPLSGSLISRRAARSCGGFSMPARSWLTLSSSESLRAATSRTERRSRRFFGHSRRHGLRAMTKCSPSSRRECYLGEDLAWSTCTCLRPPLSAACRSGLPTSGCVTPQRASASGIPSGGA